MTYTLHLAVPREEHRITNVVVDTGTTYTVLSRDVLEKVGAPKLPVQVSLELGDGRVVETDAHAIAVNDRGTARVRRPSPSRGLSRLWEPRPWNPWG
ncbi:MAG: hypothetical protein ACE5OY_07865 [Candidatus Bathyarchaeia archaeon]